MAELTEKDPEKNKKLAIWLGLAGYTMGYHVSIMNSMSGPILAPYNLTDWEKLQIQSDFNYYFALGAMIGVLISDKLHDWIGRRKINTYLDLWNVGSTALMFVENLTVLQWSRFMIGFSGVIVNALAGIVLCEILPPHLASLGNVINYFSTTFFFLASFFQPTVFSNEFMIEWYQIFLTWPALLAIARFFMLRRYFTFESPVTITQWYLDDPRYKILLKESLSAVYVADEALDMKVEEIAKYAEIAAAAVPTDMTVMDVFKKEYRLRVISSIIPMAGQQFSGINFLIFFSTELFDRISGNGASVSLAIGIGNFLGGVVALYTVNNFKRMITMKIGVLTQGAAFVMVVVFIYLKVYVLLPLFVWVYMIAYSLGLAATGGLYTNEILPPGQGVGFVAAILWALTSLIAKYTLLIADLVGTDIMLLIFAGMCGVIYVLLDRYCLDPQSDDPEQQEEAKKHLVELRQSMLSGSNY